MKAKKASYGYKELGALIPHLLEDYFHGHPKRAFLKRK